MNGLGALRRIGSETGRSVPMEKEELNMKKIRIAAIAAAIVLALGVTTAFAAGERHFVDANGDGICDNRGTGRGCWYVDADGDGVCDRYGTGLGCRSGRGCRW